MIATDLQTKLERFEASIENGTADGALLVEQCAGDVPDWEVSDCWSLGDYPRLSEFGLEPYDDGIDLIAEKTDGRRVAIQCKALSDGNVTTTMIQKFAGHGPGLHDRDWRRGCTVRRGPVVEQRPRDHAQPRSYRRAARGR